MAENTENKTLMIPFVASESSMDRLERSNKRMFIIIVFLIIGLVISNSIWLYNWMQYDYVDTYEVDVDAGEGIANYIGDDGDINNGEGTSTTIENENEA